MNEFGRLYNAETAPYATVLHKTPEVNVGNPEANDAYQKFVNFMDKATQNGELRPSGIVVAAYTSEKTIVTPIPVDTVLLSKDVALEDRKLEPLKIGDWIQSIPEREFPVTTYTIDMRHAGSTTFEFGFSIDNDGAVDFNFNGTPFKHDEIRTDQDLSETQRIELAEGLATSLDNLIDNGELALKYNNSNPGSTPTR